MHGSLLPAAVAARILVVRVRRPPPGSGGPGPPECAGLPAECSTVLRRHDELSATAAADRGRVSARRCGLEGGGARAAADLHAPSDAGGLRHGGAAADDDHPRLDRPAARARRGVRALPLPRRGRRPAPPARADCDRDAADRHDAVRARRGRGRGADLACVAGQLAAGPDPRGGARPLGVHEPRARLRAAARRGARADVRDRLADERRAHRDPHGLARRRPRRGRIGPAAGQLRRLDGRADRPVVQGARGVRPAPRRNRARAAAAGCCASGSRPSPPRSRSSRCSSSTASGCTASRVRERPACTRSRSSSPASSSSPCGRSSTRGRRWRTRSSRTRRPHASTPASRRTTCSSRASSSRAWCCSGAGSCGCSPRRSSSPPTRHCHGSRSAGRSTGSSSSSSRWPAAPR